MYSINYTMSTKILGNDITSMQYNMEILCIDDKQVKNYYG